MRKHAEKHRREYLNEWRIWDRSVQLVAVHGGNRAQIHEAYHKAPEVIRGDLIVLAPGELPPASPVDATRHTEEGR